MPHPLVEQGLGVLLQVPAAGGQGHPSRALEQVYSTIFAELLDLFYFLKTEAENDFK